MRPTRHFRAGGQPDGPGGATGANWGDAKLAPEQNELQLNLP